jgi:hypothetical protein
MCIKNTPAEEIKNIMLKHGLSYQWLASQMNTYYQKVQYAIDVQKEMPLSTYTAIMDIFEKHGFVIDSREACQNLMQTAFKVNSKFGNEIKKLNDKVSESVQDERFTPDEKLKIRFMLEDMKKEFNEQIDALIKQTKTDKE